LCLRGGFPQAGALAVRGGAQRQRGRAGRYLAPGWAWRTGTHARAVARALEPSGIGAALQSIAGKLPQGASRPRMMRFAGPLWEPGCRRWGAKRPQCTCFAQRLIRSYAPRGEPPMNLQELTERLHRIRDTNDWRGFHSPKNLAMAASVE